MREIADFRTVVQQPPLVANQVDFVIAGRANRYRVADVDGRTDWDESGAAILDVTVKLPVNPLRREDDGLGCLALIIFVPAEFDCLLAIGRSSRNFSDGMVGDKGSRPTFVDSRIRLRHGNGNAAGREVTVMALERLHPVVAGISADDRAVAIGVGGAAARDERIGACNPAPNLRCTAVAGENFRWTVIRRAIGRVIEAFAGIFTDKIIY